MKSIALTLLAAILMGCASSGPSSFDAMSIPRDLEAQGISFGIGRVPGESALTLGVHFKISATGEQEGGPVTEAAWMEAAQKAAPKGCSVKTLTPTAEGGRKATYHC